MVIFIIGFMYIEPILMKHKVKNDNEYGSARFSTDREIKKNFKIKTLGKNINENPSRNNLNNVNIAPNINVEVNNNGSNIDFNKIWTDIGNRLNAQLNASIGSL